MQTSDAVNNDFMNPILEDEDKNKKFFEIVYKIRDEYTKLWVTTNNLPNYNLY